jgi:hypothetical protein
MQHPERQKLGQTAFLLDIKVFKNLLSKKELNIDHRTCRGVNAPGSVGAWKTASFASTCSSSASDISVIPRQEQETHIAVQKRRKFHSFQTTATL